MDFQERLDTKHDLKKMCFNGVRSVILCRGTKKVESLEDKSSGQKGQKIYLAEKDESVYLLKKDAEEVESPESSFRIEDYSEEVFESLISLLKISPE